MGNTAVSERLMRIEAVWNQLSQNLYSGGCSIVKTAFIHGRVDVLKVLVSHPELARQAATEAIIEILPDWGLKLDKTLVRQAALIGDSSMVAALTAVAPVREHGAAADGLFHPAGMALHSNCREVFRHVLRYPELQPLAWVAHR